jgi:hypothetical protein
VNQRRKLKVLINTIQTEHAGNQLSARSFFSKTIDALNAIPDELYLEFEPELMKLISTGHPFPQKTA